MASVYNDLVAQIELRYTWDTEEVENILYFLYSGSGIDAANLEDLTYRIYQWYVDDLMPLQSNLLVLREVYGIQLAGPGSVTATTSPPGNSPGLQTGEALPFNSTVAISFRTGLSGRSYRGRNYVLGLIESYQVASIMQPTPLASFVAAYNDIPTFLTGPSGWSWCVYSRYAGGLPRAEGLATVVTDAVAVNNVLDSQRRRLPGRGQ